MKELGIQSIGYLACLIGVLAFQFKEHKRIVISKAITDMLFAVQYVLLGAYSGACINCIGIVRNLTLAKVKKGSKAQIPVTLLFVAVIVAVGILTWEGPLSVLAMLGKICTTVSFSIKNTKYLRLCTIPSCLLWVVYDTANASYGGAVYEILGLLSILIAYYRLDRSQKKQAEQGKI